VIKNLPFLSTFETKF